MKSALLIAGLALGLTTAAKADHDSLLPPRAKELFGHMMKSSDSGPNLVNEGPRGPAARSPVHRERVVTGTSASDPNLLGRPLYTGRNPFRNETTERFEIAPFGKAKACDANCAKPCCAGK